MVNRKVKRTSFKVGRLHFTKTFKRIAVRYEESSYDIESRHIYDSFMIQYQLHEFPHGFVFSSECSLSYLGITFDKFHFVQF